MVVQVSSFSFRLLYSFCSSSSLTYFFMINKINMTIKYYKWEFSGSLIQFPTVKFLWFKIDWMMLSILDFCAFDKLLFRSYGFGLNSSEYSLIILPELEVLGSWTLFGSFGFSFRLVLSPMSSFLLITSVLKIGARRQSVRDLFLRAISFYCLI